MLTKRGFDRLAGILCVSIFLAFAISLPLGETEVNWERDKIEESLRDVIYHQWTYLASSAFFLLGSMILVTGVAPSICCSEAMSGTSPFAGSWDCLPLA